MSAAAWAPQWVGTVCFGMAILHTFAVKLFQKVARRYPTDSVAGRFFHLLGEVEVVFGIWAILYLLLLTQMQGWEETFHFAKSQSFVEPAFVFVIMSVCATRPILQMASDCVEWVSKILPFEKGVSYYASTLFLGPLLGSFITEPAAMTVTALILLQKVYQRQISNRLKYATIGLLFVSVSIGGTLTPYAAPPVLMVAGTWGWDLAFMFTHLGWKGMVAILISTTWVTFQFRKELAQLSFAPTQDTAPVKRVPPWVKLIHLVFLALIVVGAHHPLMFGGLFLLFLGWVLVTREHQDELKLKAALLVAFFLAGLVILGAPQRWWLEPVMTRLGDLSLYVGAMGLTAIIDNAAITFLGSQVPGLSEASKYALVAGSVVGGGLTVIANAPNPAGYGILNPSFGSEGINPAQLFLAALGPTVVAALAFWFL